MDAEISAQIELSCKISMMLQAANYIFKPVWLLVARLLGVFDRSYFPRSSGLTISFSQLFSNTPKLKKLC